MQIERLAFISITRAIACATMLVYFLAAPARADEIKAGDLVISQAWTRATPKGAKIGGGYLTIENKGTAPDTLIGGSADVAGSVQVHEMSMDNGVMKMRPLEKRACDRARQDRQARAGRLSFDDVGLEEPAKEGRQTADHLGVRKGGQGAGVPRRRGRRRAGADHLPQFWQQEGYERYVSRDEDVRVWGKGDTRRAAKSWSSGVAELAARIE